MPQRLIRLGDLRQRRTRMALLPARLPAALAAQRARRGLNKRRIRRRWLRRVPTVLPQLPPQLGNLSLKLVDPLSLRCHHSGKLVIGRRRIGSHHTMILASPDHTAARGQPFDGTDACTVRLCPRAAVW
jgi:hypothetical protein